MVPAILHNVLPRKVKEWASLQPAPPRRPLLWPYLRSPQVAPWYQRDPIARPGSSLQGQKRTKLQLKLQSPQLSPFVEFRPELGRTLRIPTRLIFPRFSYQHPPTWADTLIGTDRYKALSFFPLSITHDALGKPAFEYYHWKYESESEPLHHPANAQLPQPCTASQGTLCPSGPFIPGQVRKSTPLDIQNVAMPFNILETAIKPRRNVSREGFIDDHYFRSKCFNIEYQGTLSIMQIKRSSWMIAASSRW